ncbi:MAG: hypothetical protein RIC35_17100 [Marinoscillum sp.]
MKKSFELFKMLSWVLALVIVFTSCDTGDDIDDAIDDIVNKGETVDDGIYLMGSASSTSAESEYVLSAGTVGDAAERSGFYGSYVYLSQGSVQFVSFIEGDSTIFGGSVESLPLGGGDSEFTYLRGALAEDGASVEIAEEGVYHVHLDLTTNLFFVTKVDYFEVIGAATEDGWNSGQELAIKSATKDEIVFEGEDIVMRSGEYKFRYNSNWDTNIEDIEDLNLHSNFGAEGIAGGSNLSFTEADGKYTITVTITTGVDATTAWTFDKTGDVEEITFDPAEYNFGVIGDATAGSWDSDQDLFYKGKIDGAHTWLGVVTFAETGAFKFRTNDDWTFSLGGTLLADGSAGDISTTGGDIATPGTGVYYINISTSDEGETWAASMTNVGWGIIGEGSPQGNWDADMDLSVDGFADGITTYSITGDFTTAGWKFRAADAWDYNIGGDMTALTVDGGDLTVAEAGTYKVVLSYDGSTYSVTATKQ